MAGSQGVLFNFCRNYQFSKVIALFYSDCTIVFDFQLLCVFTNVCNCLFNCIYSNRREVG